jgi:hypothetical protein
MSEDKSRKKDIERVTAFLEADHTPEADHVYKRDKTIARSPFNHLRLRSQVIENGEEARPFSLAILRNRGQRKCKEAQMPCYEGIWPAHSPYMPPMGDLSRRRAEALLRASSTRWKYDEIREVREVREVSGLSSRTFFPEENRAPHAAARTHFMWGSLP